MAKDETRLLFAFAIQTSSLASSFFRIMSWNWSTSARASIRDGLDGGDDYGIGLGHAISIDGHEMRNSSGRGNPLQLLFAGRFRPTSACCPLANGAEGSPEPLRLQATPELSAIATAAAPLALKEQIVCVERALPRSEHVGSPATQRLPNEIATMPQAADNLLDRQAVRASSRLPHLYPLAGDSSRTAAFLPRGAARG